MRSFDACSPQAYRLTSSVLFIDGGKKMFLDNFPTKMKVTLTLHSFAELDLKNLGLIQAPPVALE